MCWCMIYGEVAGVVDCKEGCQNAQWDVDQLQIRAEKW